MVKKLSLRERLKFWRENKIWLKKIDRSKTYEQYGMILYEGNDGSIWGVENADEKIRLIKISQKRDDYGWEDCCKEMYSNKDDSGYIFGKKGIFYTKSKEDKWECIYADENIRGMMINISKGIVIIFKKESDIVYRINEGSLSEEPLIENMHIAYYGSEEIYYYKDEVSTFYGDIPLLVKDRCDTYSYYLITKNEVHDPQIKFKNLDKWESLRCNQLVKVYSEKHKCSVLVTLLVGGKIKIHYTCEEFVSLGKDHYLAKSSRDKKYHFLKYVSLDEILNLGVVPEEGKYSYAESIVGIHFYTVKSEKGITLLAVNEDKLESKFYEGAIGIQLTKPILFENNNVMEVKAIATYEKVVDEN